jgi:hypothetical protein
VHFVWPIRTKREFVLDSIGVLKMQALSS